MDALCHLHVATLETNTLDLKQHPEQKWVREAISGHCESTYHTMCDAAMASASDGVGGSVSYDMTWITRVTCPVPLWRELLAIYIRDGDQWQQGQESLIVSVLDPQKRQATKP